MIKVKYEPGICPKCGGTDIAYGTIEPETNAIFYPFECENCGLIAREYHILELDGLYVDERIISENGEFKEDKDE